MGQIWISLRNAESLSHRLGHVDGLGVFVVAMPAAKTPVRVLGPDLVVVAAGDGHQLGDREAPHRHARPVL